MALAQDDLAALKCEDLNRRLIIVARNILERQGLGALTLRAAARSAGVSHMAPYRHYSSKDELLAAVAEKGFKDLAQAMDSSIDLFGDPQYRLRAFVRTYLTFALGNRALYRLMFGADLQNRSRFSRLVAASQECCSRCVSVVAPEVDPDGKERCLPRKAIATWSFAHGLASLALDGLVEFPQISNPKFSHELDELLAATDLTER